jgi:hypothetical protein
MSIKIFKWNILFCLSLVWGASSALAQDFLDALNEQMDVIQQISSKSALDFTTGKCVDRYQKLWKDGTLNIVIGFGYTDSVPNDVVFDFFMGNAFRKALTGPCRQGVSACEFTQSRTSPTKFTKLIETLDGQFRQVQITLLIPSISGSHRLNTSPVNSAKQSTACKNAESAFYQEVRNGAEIVYYSGHSRDGGGPDFCPPKTLPNGHVDYSWYRRNQPGLKLLLSNMSVARQPTQVLALHACASVPHFLRPVQSQFSGLAVLGYHQLVKIMPDFQNQYGGLDSFLSFKCQKGMKESMSQGIATEIFKLF